MPSRTDNVVIRKVEPSDLDTFYEHQLDPDANRMAAWVCKDPKDRAAFDAHWGKILNSPQNTNRTIEADGQIAGHVSCYPHGEFLEVTYWIGKESWGRGIASQALAQMLQLVATRPITARAAVDNIGSLRVLQKNGFKIIGKDKGFANGRGEDTEEYLLRLDGVESVNEVVASSGIELLRTAYAAFNRRDIDAALATMTPDVSWPMAFKGGFVRGPAEIRAYWKEQWGEIDPHVEPVAFFPESSSRILVDVHQVVRDLAGVVVADMHVGHRFTFSRGLIHSMEVCPLPSPVPGA